MAGYDNSRYTYAQVLSGTGYYKQDSNLKYSSGVKKKAGLKACKCKETE